MPQRWVVVGPLSLPYARATRGGRDPEPVEPAFWYLCGVTCKKESGVKLARWDTGEGGSWLKLKLDSGSHCGRPLLVARHPGLREVLGLGVGAI